MLQKEADKKTTDGCKHKADCKAKAGCKDSKCTKDKGGKNNKRFRHFI